jgi:hypothetical protein
MNQKRTKPFQIKLTEDEHATLMKLAAKRALRTGNRISAGDMLRELAFANPRAVEAKTDKTDGVKVTVTLRPEIRAAVVRSGMDISQIVNDAIAREMLMEAGA